MCPATLSTKAGKAAACRTACPPSSTRFHQPRGTTTLSDGQPARCIQGQVAMATASTCYAECLLPSRHGSSLPEEQPASSLAAVPVNRRLHPPPLPPSTHTHTCTPHPQCSDTHSGGGGGWGGALGEPPHPATQHPNPCGMFFSALTPPLPPLYPLPRRNAGKIKSKQQ